MGRTCRGECGCLDSYPLTLHDRVRFGCRRRRGRLRYVAHVLERPWSLCEAMQAHVEESEQATDPARHRRKLGHGARKEQRRLVEFVDLVVELQPAVARRQDVLRPLGAQPEWHDDPEPICGGFGVHRRSEPQSNVVGGSGSLAGGVIMRALSVGAVHGRRSESGRLWFADRGLPPGAPRFPGERRRPWLGRGILGVACRAPATSLGSGFSVAANHPARDPAPTLHAGSIVPPSPATRIGLGTEDGVAG